MPATGDFTFSVRVGGGHVQLEEYFDVSSQLLSAITMLRLLMSNFTPGPLNAVGL
jgi:hypothetical protein